MAKIRKDTKGRVLHRGEDYHKGKKLYRYSYIDPLKKRRCIYAKELTELREKIKQLKRDQLDGIDVYSQGRSDINTAFDRYISTKTELRSSTRSQYLYLYNHFIRNGFGKRKITEVCFSDVVLFYGALSQQGLKVRSIETIHFVLRPAFQLAVRDNIIRTNPAAGAMSEMKRKWREFDSSRHALTLEQERIFFNELDKPRNRRWKNFFVVMFGTGCRIGELIGLRWEDIDFENGLISINHNVSHHIREEKGFKMGYELSLPKTQSGIRTIPMLAKVREVLEQQYASYKEFGNPCRMELGGMTNFIFCNRYGNIFNSCTVNPVIKRIVLEYNEAEEANAIIENRQPVKLPIFSCHIARHTFCSRLCENDTNIKVIQSVMGHKDVNTTLGIYAEVSDKKKQEAFLHLDDKDIF